MPQMSKDETRLKEWLKDIRSIEKELNRQGYYLNRSSVYLHLLSRNS